MSPRESGGKSEEHVAIAAEKRSAVEGFMLQVPNGHELVAIAATKQYRYTTPLFPRPLLDTRDSWYTEKAKLTELSSESHIHRYRTYAGGHLIPFWSSVALVSLATEAGCPLP